MKYNIFINQYWVVKNNLVGKVDETDLCLLDYIHSFTLSKKSKKITFEKEVYTWINITHLIKNMPVIKITNSSNISRRISKLEKVKLIKKHLSPENSLYIKSLVPVEYYSKPLTEDEKEFEEYYPHLHKRGCADTQEHNNPIYNNKDIIPYGAIVGFLNHKAGSNFNPNSNKNQKLIKARWNEGYREEDFRLVIQYKIKEWQDSSEMRRYIRPETLFSGKFDRYLNEAKSRSAPANNKKNIEEFDDQQALLEATYSEFLKRRKNYE